MRYAFASVALFVSNLALATTPIDGFYASVFGGYTYLPNNIDNYNSGLLRTDATYQDGYHAGGSFGYKANPLRYEGQMTYLTADVKEFRINGLQQSHTNGLSQAILAMANVYYDFPGLIQYVQPYLGVGIGYAWVEVQLNTPNPYYTRFKQSDSAFAYQGLAGFSFNYAETLSLNIGYRYAATPQIDPLGKHFQAHLATLEAVYRFDGNRYK